MSRRGIFAAALLALGLAFAVAACGGSSGSQSKSATPTSASSGKSVFTSAGCGGCHTLKAAGSGGTVGPNLDSIKPTKEQVAQQVSLGGGGMPSFAKTLSAAQIEAVSEYVATSAGSGGATTPIGFTPGKTTLADCRETPTFQCFQQAFGDLAYTKGPKIALAEFTKDISTNSTIEAGCHPIAHTIGAGSLLYFKGNIGRAFADGTAVCGSGYYHGLMQWKLAGVAPNRVAAVAQSACNAASIEANAFKHYQCVHGLGHGLMLYTRYNLPEALKLCHKLDTDFNQTSCTGGVFMENQQSSYGLTSKWLSNKNLLYPCTIVATRDKLYCYLLVTSQILPKVGYDWKKTADWCRRSDPGFVDICFQSYGRDASGSAREDPAQIKTTCAMAGSGQKECIFGGVRDVLNNEPSDIRARTLCLIVDRQFRSYCFFGLGTILGTVWGTDAERRRACTRFAKGGADFADCMRGAQPTS